MKKLIVVLMAAAMLFSFSACGEGDITEKSTSSDTAQTESSVSSDTVSKVKESDYKDDLDGICEYLTDSGIIIKSDKEPENMQAAVIGAENGRKYTFSNDGKDNIKMEIYEFDNKSNDETTKKYLDEAKNGKITVVGNQLEATLSDSGKYIMIYTDSVNNESHEEMKKNAVETFKSFKK